MINYNNLLFDFENLRYTWEEHPDLWGELKCIDGIIYARDGDLKGDSIVFYYPEVWVRFDNGYDSGIQELWYAYVDSIVEKELLVYD